MWSDCYKNRKKHSCMLYCMMWVGGHLIIIMTMVVRCGRVIFILFFLGGGTGWAVYAS